MTAVGHVGIVALFLASIGRGHVHSGSEEADALKTEIVKYKEGKLHSGHVVCRNVESDCSIQVGSLRHAPVTS